MIHDFNDKIATSLKSNAIFSYPVQVVSVHFRPTFRRSLIDNKYIFAGLLPVGTSTNEHEEQEVLMKERQFVKHGFLISLCYA